MSTMKDRKMGWLRWVSGAFAAVGLLLWFGTAVEQVRADHSLEDRRLLEQALRRAAVTCYAAEGVYPPDLAYLTEHYGIVIDEARYTIFYEVFGENLMPEITVVETKNEKR